MNEGSISVLSDNVNSFVAMVAQNMFVCLSGLEVKMR